MAYGVLAQASGTTIDDALPRAVPVVAPGFLFDVLERGSPGPFADVWDRAAADGRVDLRELRGTPVVVNLPPAAGVATEIPETFFLSARGDVVGHVGTVDDRLLADGVAAVRSGRPLAAGRGAQLPPR